MFEKEAKEWFDQSEFRGTCSMGSESFRLSATSIWQNGAEFGYNKANEWHYVKSEEDLPTDKKEYLLLLGSNIRTFGFYNGKFWESWKGDFSWQEVKAYFFVPVPEIKESE